MTWKNASHGGKGIALRILGFFSVYFGVFLSFIWLVSSAVNTEATMEDTKWSSSDHGQCMPVFSDSLVHVDWDGRGER